ncbi:MAG: acyl-CoA synthetase [Bacteroidia bacterium]
MTFPERFAEVVVDFPRKKILADKNGAYSSDEIFLTAQFVAAEILEHKNYKGECICLLAPAGLPYVAGMLGGMMSGAMMVPLCTDHPKAELEYIIADSGAKLILCHPDLLHLVNEIKVPKKKLTASSPPKEPVPYNWDYPAGNSNALMLYTSGTTGKPKGVVHTHASLAAQISCLVEVWEWTDEDSILHFLPLHHTHGIINKLFCALWSGAYCEMMEKFDAKLVWEKIASGKFNLLMGVPTVYSRLIQHWEEKEEATKKIYSDACGKFRLMVSGSAALPVTVLEKWKTVSGHILLERYGMTETGMALTNPLHGERKPGFVGKPLPGMEARLAEKNDAADTMSELEIRGKNLFKEYWNKPEETKKSFTKDGWFKTGDMAEVVDGNYKIVGRLSADIIKSAGYKISSLEIEAVILQHASVKECCVIGMEDEMYGEKIVAVIVLNENALLSLDELREFSKEKLAAYKLPVLMKVIEQLPRNVMGKVMKGEVKNLIFS